MDLATYDMYHEPPSPLPEDPAEIPLPDALDGYDDDGVSIAPRQDKFGEPQNLDDILNRVDNNTDSLAEDAENTPFELSRSSATPTTLSRTSSQSSKRPGAVDAASIISSVKSILSRVSRPAEDKSPKLRPHHLTRLINDSEKHCMHLIEDRSEMQKKLNEAVIETLECQKDIAKLQLEKRNLRRALDDARQEIVRMKKKVQYCDREHLFFN